MFRKTVSGIMLALLLTSIATLAFIVRPVKSETIIVPDDHTTIQAAINAASPGDTIYVRAGTYYEHVVVDKTISLIGENKTTTIIDGGETGTVVNVTASNVTISEFMIRNSGPYDWPICRGLYILHSVGSVISRNIITRNRGGIMVVDSNYTIIEYNIVESNDGVGISLKDSIENVIKENWITNNCFSVVDEGASNKIVHNVVTSNLIGILPSFCTQIIGNTITNNSYYGLKLRGSSMIIHNNTIVGNGDGIILDAAKYNNISHNIISLNHESGIRIEQASPGNIFRYNNLTGNGWNFGVFAGYLSDFRQDIDFSNTVDGRPIYYFVDEQDQQVPADAGYVAAINCVNITVRDLSLTNNLQGVLFAGTTNSTIENVNASNNWIGIQLILGSSHNIICNNILRDNEWRGIELMLGCSRNRISGNMITANRPIHTSNYPWHFVFTIKEGVGLALSSMSGVNIVENNEFTWNEIGIYIGHGDGWTTSDYNIVRCNRVINNYEYGVYASNTKNNTIYHNIFLNNLQNAYSSSSLNTWDNGYPSGGNYWSDYRGTDLYGGQHQNVTGRDGVGDIPYTIDRDNRDLYPLMTPWAPPAKHELIVVLQTPIFLQPGLSSLLNVTVANKGLNNETDVTLSLLINGRIAKSVTTPSLNTNSSHTFRYNWTPTSEGTYNITVYAPAVPGEENIANNQLTTFVRVKGPIMVPHDYLTIQEAVEAADPGETIFVRAGTYHENVVIGKLGLRLVGENPATTIIDAEGETGIKITANKVIVTNFTIKNSGWGIELVEADRCTITRNIVTNNNKGGIALSGSSNNTISENNVTANGGWLEGGISLKPSGFFWFEKYSDYNTVVGNNLINNTYGIKLSYSDYNNVSKNMVISNDNGIIIESSHGNLLRDNNLNANSRSFGVYAWTSLWTGLVRYEDFIHDIDTSNTVDGKTVHYLVNKSDLVINSSDIGYLALINCTNIHVKGLTLKNNGQGLLLAFTTNSTIQNVTTTNNEVGICVLQSNRNTITSSTATNNEYGISLYYASFNNITKNTITNNGGGVSIGINMLALGWRSIPHSAHAENNTISGNIISNNTGSDWEGGIVLAGEGTIYNTIRCNTILGNYRGLFIMNNASDNRIYHNNFIDNKKQVYFEEGVARNIWDDGYPSGGNYWSDYNGTDDNGDGIGDTSYIIDADNQDKYPLMKPYVLVGDVNRDGVVNIKDLALFGKAFGSYPGHPRWNPVADIDGNGIINIVDATIIAKNFGKTL